MIRPTRNLARLDAVLEQILQASRIPGIAIAVVSGGEMIYAKGFGYRDAKHKKPMRPHTAYPIASTTKAMNATILGMLIDEGIVGWDVPVDQYLPEFRLKDAAISSRVTVRDLVTMRTGVPRHDWVWVGSRTTRAELVRRFSQLQLSADFRQRFQYCSLSVTIAGHIAEVVTGESWETLAYQRLFRPLQMRQTKLTRPKDENVTLSYHENVDRKLLLSKHLTAEATAPSGGAIYSTVTDMSRWVLFNLKGGKAQGRQLIAPQSLAHIHAPQVIIGTRSLTSLPPDAAYSLGWMVDSYRGHRRISHGGYLDDVNSSVMFFPTLGIGMISFTNFGCSGLADVINQYAFCELMGLKPEQTFAAKLEQYEKKIKDTRQQNDSVKRVANTRPSHSHNDYAGRYEHPGYGEMTVRVRGGALVLEFRELRIRLQYWHYDVWVAEDSDMWAIHVPHPFGRTFPIEFHTNAQGKVAGLSTSLEPEVDPIRFVKL